MSDDGTRVATGADSAALKSLLDYLKGSRGFDFSGYKRTSLERRIRKRMQVVEIERYDEYQDYLQVTPNEFTDLFDTILINVTGFFRDKPAWDYVASDVIPPILEGLSDPEPIRIWSAACASGEEAYTIAVLFAEALGEEEFRRRVKIYATDVDEDALARARQATFPRDALKSVPDEYVTRYFGQSPLGYSFRGDLRRSVIFGRNDLVQDAPISRIDLLVSRNALMYFTPETQARILGHFNFGLKRSGFLFLGKSEMLITHTDLFTPHNLKWRVFRKVPRLGLSERLAFLGDNSVGEAEASGRYGELRGGAFDRAPVAQLVVDRSGFVTEVNQAARDLFDLGAAEVGRPLQDLELSYRPVDLRSALEEAYLERRDVAVGRVPWKPARGEAKTLEVLVAPIPGTGTRALGATISFFDATEIARLDEEHQRSQRQLETAYEELQSTVEELETTNEELHSTNEELETTNEELQSTNEELETMNEELQSTNDELETMNEEQTSRSLELDRANLFLEGILASLGVGVVVLDREQLVQVWNANSTELWGLRPDEVEGQHFLALDTGFPVEALKEPIRAMLSGDQEQSQHEVDAVTRRGRKVSCRVRMVPLKTDANELYGVIVMMAVDGQTMMLPAPGGS
jgi:two-component system, chemotaxis family, CheB/CheR fusion protein